MVESSETSLAKLVDALNEGDADLRQRLLEKVWAADGVYMEDGGLAARSRQELGALIASRHEDPDFFIKSRPVKTARDREWTRWKIHSLHEPTEVQRVVADRLPSGHLSHVDARTTSESHASASLARRLQEAALANPLPAVGAFGGALFLALRIPVGLFYGDLGVTPDELGYGPEVLVPQTVGLLALFLSAMALLYFVIYLSLPVVRVAQASLRLWRKGSRNKAVLSYLPLGLGAVLSGVGAMVVIGPKTGDILDGMLPTFGALGGAVLGGVLAGRLDWLADDLEEVRDQGRRAGLQGERLKGIAVMTAIYGAAFLVLGLPVWAAIDASNVRRGGSAGGGRLAPWRAVPAELRWLKGPRAQLNNSCRALRFLGTREGQMIIFDTSQDKVFRIPVANAMVSLERHCPRSKLVPKGGRPKKGTATNAGG